MPTPEQSQLGVQFTIAGQSAVRSERINRRDGTPDPQVTQANEQIYDGAFFGLSGLDVHNYLADPPGPTFEGWVAVRVAASVGMSLDGNPTDGYTVTATVLDKLNQPMTGPGSELLWESSAPGTVLPVVAADTHSAVLHVVPLVNPVDPVAFQIRTVIASGAHFGLPLILQPDGSIVADNS